MSSAKELELLRITAGANSVRTVALAELIGIDENVAASNYSKSISINIVNNIGGETITGNIKSIELVSSESGTGAVLTPAGVLYFFKADPTIAANDAALTGIADHRNIIGQIDFVASDWWAAESRSRTSFTRR